MSYHAPLEAFLSAWPSWLSLRSTRSRFEKKVRSFREEWDWERLPQTGWAPTLHPFDVQRRKLWKAVGFKHRLLCYIHNLQRGKVHGDHLESQYIATKAVRMLTRGAPRDKAIPERKASLDTISAVTQQPAIIPLPSSPPSSS